MAHISVILASSLSWDDDAAAAHVPRLRREYVQRESMLWQQVSQRGADAELQAWPSPIRRTYTLNGRAIRVPRRGRTLPQPNRLLEIHGIAGAIGEQLGLAWTAEQDVQRFVQTRSDRIPEHQRLIQRALAELAGHFVLGASHSLANMCWRLLLLNPRARNCLNTACPRALGFPPGSDDRRAWLTFNATMLKNMTSAAGQGGNRFMIYTAETLRTLYSSHGFTALDSRRGMDYHRRRPQSVEHVSPRRDIVEQGQAQTTLSMPWPALEVEADPDQVHDVVVEALLRLRDAMRDLRRTMPKLIRDEGITYIF